jgi:hypothetical protein
MSDRLPCGSRVVRPDRRGAWQPPRPEPPPACPKCGSAVELIAGDGLAAATCPAPSCSGSIAIYRRQEGRWILAERLTGFRAGQAARPAAIAESAG